MPKGATKGVITWVAIILVLLGALLATKLVSYLYSSPTIAPVSIEEVNQNIQAVDKLHKQFVIGLRSSTTASQALDLQHFVQTQASVQSVAYFPKDKVVSALEEQYRNSPSFVDRLLHPGRDLLGGAIVVDLKDNDDYLLSEIQDADSGGIVYYLYYSGGY